MNHNSPLSNVDALNFAVVRLQPYRGELRLGSATGFFYTGKVGGDDALWLVTNWHVLSGRSACPPNQPLHEGHALPDRIVFRLIRNQRSSEGTSDVSIQDLSASLFDDQGSAKWYQHKTGPAVDVGVLRLDLNREDYYIRGINEIASQNDMAISVGSQVFVLGYPLGFTHFVETPIWKSGAIASEPHLETERTQRRVLIDATTRQGMSGAPVIIRERTHYLSEAGIVVEHPNATRFIGVYASRPDIPGANELPEADRRAEVGFFYKSGCVEETIAQGNPGPSSD